MKRGQTACQSSHYITAEVISEKLTWDFSWPSWISDARDTKIAVLSSVVLAFWRSQMFYLNIFQEVNSLFSALYFDNTRHHLKEKDDLLISILPFHQPEYRDRKWRFLSAVPLAFRVVKFLCVISLTNLLRLLFKINIALSVGDTFNVPRHVSSCFSALNSIEPFYCFAEMDKRSRNVITSLENIMIVAKLFMQTFKLVGNLSENGEWISFYIHRVSCIGKYELSLPVGSETAGG